jgi:sarcosine oxidase, subunit beta
MFQLFSRQRMWRQKRDLQRQYDVVIIGAGIHGLAIAYYLCKRGIRNVVVLDKSYLGSGNSGRNTAILRSNYRTSEGIPFYDESIRLWETLAAELEYNLLFSQQGHITLAHTDTALTGLRVRAAANQVLGVKTYMVDPHEIKKMVPALYTGEDVRYPIVGGLYHPPGGNIRHDAVVWAYARAADRMGASIHTHTEVIGILTRNGAVTGVRTSAGEIQTSTVVNATSGWCTTIARMVGVPLPVTSFPLQACVTEPLKPFMHKVIVSANLHVYVNQSDRGELVLGSEIDPYSSYSKRSTLPTLEMIAKHTLELFPCLRDVSVMRQWTGVCDMTPDYSPILGAVPGLRGFVLDVGWGTYGFKAGPVAGARIAELIHTGKTPELILPFSLVRFAEDRLVGEKAAAAVST